MFVVSFEFCRSGLCILYGVSNTVPWYFINSNSALILVPVSLERKKYWASYRLIRISGSDLALAVIRLGLVTCWPAWFPCCWSFSVCKLSLRFVQSRCGLQTWSTTPRVPSVCLTPKSSSRSRFGTMARTTAVGKTTITVCCVMLFVVSVAKCDFTDPRTMEHPGYLGRCDRFLNRTFALIGWRDTTVIFSPPTVAWALWKS